MSAFRAGPHGAFSPASEAYRIQEVAGRQEITEVEATEEGVLRRTLVEPHRVDDVFQVGGVAGPEGHAPLPVVDPRRGGDELRDPAGEPHAAAAVLAHQLRADLEGERVPVLVPLAHLAHRVEAE